MKLKKGFYMREIAGRTVVVPTGIELGSNMMITLNDTGCLLWKKLETGAEMSDLIKVLTAKFNVDETTAADHTAKFVETLRANDFLED